MLHKNLTGSGLNASFGKTMQESRYALNRLPLLVGERTLAMGKHGTLGGDVFWGDAHYVGSSIGTN